MVSRRKLREKASQVKESVAGTVGEKTKQAKQKGKSIAGTLVEGGKLVTNKAKQSVRSRSSGGVEVRYSEQDDTYYVLDNGRKVASGETKEQAAGAAQEYISNKREQQQTQQEQSGDNGGSGGLGSRLRNFGRDDSPPDQQEARVERARQQAQQEARQEARQEFIEEYREEMREQFREEEKQQLRRQYNVGQDQQESGAFGSLLGPPPESGESMGSDPPGPSMPFMAPPPEQGAQDPAPGPVVPGMGPPPGEQDNMGGGMDPQMPPIFGEEPEGERDDEPMDFPFPY